MNNKFFFGIDIGGTATKLGAFNVDGLLLKKWEIPTDTAESGTRILPNVAKEILDFAQDLSHIAAVGVGVPGPVLHSGYVKRCVNLGWGDFNPARELSALLHGVPVFAGNDANMAAMGEYWQGGGKGAHNLVFLTLGTGVGGGVIINDRLVFGQAGLAGEIGHIVVNPDETVPCNCGQLGCLDQTASARGIVRRAELLLKTNPTPSVLRSIDAFTARDVFDAAKNGDPIACETVRTCIGFLGKAMAMLTNILDPEVFIIGGGVSKAGEYLLNIAREKYKSYAVLSDQRAKVVLAELGNDAGIYGAAKLAMDSFR